MKPAARTQVIEKTLHHLAEARNGVSLLDGPSCVDAQLLDDLYEKWLRAIGEVDPAIDVEVQG